MSSVQIIPRNLQYISLRPKFLFLSNIGEEIVNITPLRVNYVPDFKNERSVN